MWIELSTPPLNPGYYPLISKTEEPTMAYWNGSAWEALKLDTEYKQWLVRRNKYTHWFLVTEFNG